MSANGFTTRTSTLRVTADRTQHCIVVKEPHGRTTAMEGCPMTGGKGEEFSPLNLVGAGLAGCMLFTMDHLARRSGLDVTGTEVDVDVSLTDTRIGAIDLRFILPGRFSSEERVRLQRAASACPIKPSFHPDIPITVRFEYPE